MRHLLRIAAAMSAAAIACGAMAQDYPSQPIRFVTGFPPGSGADVVTRFMAEKIKSVAGANVIVENRVGAAGNIATEAVARAKPDGYTALLGTATALAASMHLFKNPPVDVGKAFRIAAPISRQGFMITVAPNSPYKSIAELTAAMKAKGDKGNYSAAAPSGIVLGELYRAMAGLLTQQVRFRSSGDSLPEILAGNIDFGSIDPQFALAQARQGRLRILAVSTGQRLRSIPDIPTMHESGVTGMDLTGWWAIQMPAATPDAIVEKINGWVKEILPMPDTQKFFSDTGGDTFYLSAAEANALFLKEIENWGRYTEIAKLEKQ